MPETSIEQKFELLQGHLRAAAEAIQELLAGDFPPVTKARYEATTKLEEAYMWAANGVQAKVSMESRVEQAATGMANEVAAGGTPGLRVLPKE